MIPLATAAATAASKAISGAVNSKGRSDPQLQVIMSGFSATAVLNAAIVLLKFAFTGKKVQPGAMARILVAPQTSSNSPGILPFRARIRPGPDHLPPGLG